MLKQFVLTRHPDETMDVHDIGKVTTASDMMTLLIELNNNNIHTLSYSESVIR